MTVQSRWLDISAADGGRFQGYLALPPAGTGPGIVLIQEIFGVNAHIRGVAEQYAQDGYVVLAPDVFWRQQPHVELGYAAADMEKAVQLMQRADLDQTVDDIGATAKALRALPEVTGNVAAIGYCFGGKLAYLAAARGSVDAAVAYYGGGIDQHLDQAEAIHVPMLFHFGGKDSHIPAASVDKIASRFAQRDNAAVYVYPEADHGFNCWSRGSYHPHSAALAHGRSLVFLGERL